MNDEITKTLEKIKRLARLEKYIDAIDLADRLAKDYPDEVDVFVARAYVNERFGDYAAAIDGMSRAIQKCAVEPHYFFSRGRYYFTIENYIDAVEDFTRTLELCDHYQSDYYRVAAHLFRADAYVRLKLYDKARADCDQIHDNLPMWTDKLRRKSDILTECA